MWWSFDDAHVHVTFSSGAIVTFAGVSDLLPPTATWMTWSAAEADAGTRARRASSRKAGSVSRRMSRLSYAASVHQSEQADGCVRVSRTSRCEFSTGWSEIGRAHV